MRSKAEVEAYLQALEKMRDAECSCAQKEFGHTHQCNAGKVAINGVVISMRWILGNDPEADQIVKQTLQLAENL